VIGLSPCPGPDWNPNHSLKLKHVFLIRKAVLSDNFIENHPHSVLKYLPHIQIHKQTNVRGINSVAEVLGDTFLVLVRPV